MKFEIDTLGIIRSPYKEKFAIPRQPGLVKSARARLELLPPYDQPDVLRGMAVAEELQDMATAAQAPVTKDMGPAEVVHTAPPEWPADRWAAGLPKWLDGITQGKAIADVLAWLNSKATVTPEQEKQLREQAAKRAQAPTTNPDDLAQAMRECVDLDKLYEFGGLLEAITDEAQRLRVTEIFDARVAELEQP